MSDFLNNSHNSNFFNFSQNIGHTRYIKNELKYIDLTEIS